MRISKSKFVAGVQCLKRLYLQVHESELAAEPDEASKAVMEQGHQVGLEAQKAFPGGVTVKAGPAELDKAIKATRDLVANSEAPAIFEATFQHGDVLVRTDVLKRSGRSGHRLIEVKSSTKVKPHYAYDIAIQRHVLTGAGIDVKQASLMHLNRDYIFNGKEYDLSQLFVEAEVKPGDAVSQSEISDRLKEQFRILNKPKPPDIKPGAQCEDPYGWRQEQMAENSQAISELGKQLYDRIRTFVGHFESVGGALGRAVDSYNKATGSLESRVLPSARRFKDLGAATGEEIVEIEPVDESPRALAIPEKSET
jgi:hypothetical protein